MPSFDLVVVGAGGGPSETNLSGYLLKAHEKAWSDGIVGIEAGSGLGALKGILRSTPDLFAGDAKDSERGIDAMQVYAYLRTYLITHAHLDHVASLVLLAGSREGQRKHIKGSRQCLEDVAKHIFEPARIWPNLASWDPNDSDFLYLYDPLPDDTEAYTPLHDGISVSMLPVSHGADHTSSAFFIRHDASAREFLFFGDVEPDTLAAHPHTAAVWSKAAPKICNGVLDAVFIECSWPAGRPDAALYGHLSPEHLVAELEMLARAIVEYRERNRDTTSGAINSTASRPRKRDSDSASPARKRPRHSRARDASESSAGEPELRGALVGLRVYVTHCKDDMEAKPSDRPMHLVISDQVRTLVEEKGLGASIYAVEQGTLIQI